MVAISFVATEPSIIFMRHCGKVKSCCFIKREYFYLFTMTKSHLLCIKIDSQTLLFCKWNSERGFSRNPRDPSKSATVIPGITLLIVAIHIL